MGYLGGMDEMYGIVRRRDEKEVPSLRRGRVSTSTTASLQGELQRAEL